MPRLRFTLAGLAVALTVVSESLAARGNGAGTGRVPATTALLATNGGLETKAVCAVAWKLVPLVLAVGAVGRADLERWRRSRYHRGVDAGDLAA